MAVLPPAQDKPLEPDTSENSPATKKGPSNLVVRIAAAAVMVPMVLLIAWYGGLAFTAFVALLGVLMAFEWTRMAHKGDTVQLVLHALATLLAAFSIFLSTPQYVIFIIAAIWLVSVVLATDKSNFKWILLGVPYITLPVFALVWLRADAAFGAIAVFSVFAAVWSADSLAYFAGRGLGGPKLWPSVSPNKTWSGFFGAVAGGLLGAVLVFYITGQNNLGMAAVLGAAIGGLEQGGDLLESAAKRTFGIKDSGAIIPGHGGVLDRVDGLMVAVVFALIVGIWRSDFTNAAAGFVNW